MVVRELFARLGLDVDKSAFDAADKSITGLHKGLLALGAALGGAAVGVGLLVKNLADAGDRVDKTSQRLGIGRAELQELEYAAGTASISADDLGNSLRALGRRAAEAAQGNAGFAAHFRKAGISVTDASGKVKSAGALFEEVADRLAALPEGGQRSAMAMNLLGDAGIRMIPLLSAGSVEIARLRREAHELGGVLGDDVVDAGANFGTALLQLQLVLSGLRNEVIGGLLPAITEALQDFSEFVKVNREILAVPLKAFVTGLVSALKALLSITLPVVKVMVAVTGAVANSVWAMRALTIGFWAAVAALAAYVVGQVAAQLAMMATVAGGIVPMIGALAALTVGYIKAAAAGLLAILPFILLGTKILLVGLAIAILVDEILSFWTGAKSVFDDFLYLMKELWIEIKWIGKQLKGWAGEFIDEWKAKIADFVSWAVSKLKSIPSAISDGIKGVAGKLPGGAWAINHLMGGGASPEASVAASPAPKSTSINAPMNLSISVQGSASPEETATNVLEQIEDVLSTKMAETLATVG